MRPRDRVRPAGSGGTAAEFLLAIPDWVDRVAEENGERLVVRFRPGELPEHGRRLVESLGVTVEISDAAPGRVVLRDPVDVARRRPVSEMAQRARTMGDFQPTQERDRKRVPATAGKNAEEMRADEAAVRDAQTVTARCALCDWMFTGRADLAREEAARHRAKRHADAPRDAKEAQHERALEEAEWRRQRAELDVANTDESQDTREAPPAKRIGRPPVWSEEKVIELVRARASGGVAPTQKELGVAWKTIKRLFGTYVELCARAGVAPPPRTARKGAGPAGEVASTAENQPPTAGPAPEPPVSLVERLLEQMSVRDLRGVKHAIEADINGLQHELVLIERALAHVRGEQP